VGAVQRKASDVVLENAVLVSRPVFGGLGVGLGLEGLVSSIFQDQSCIWPFVELLYLTVCWTSKTNNCLLFASYTTKTASALVVQAYIEAASATPNASMKSVINNDQFKCLRPFDNSMYCVPATSAPVERIFSHGGIFMRDHRARMSDSVLCNLVFTARCTLVQSAVLRSHVVCLSVCLSVCDVGGSGSHRSEILETNCTDT